MTAQAHLAILRLIEETFLPGATLTPSKARTSVGFSFFLLELLLLSF